VGLHPSFFSFSSALFASSLIGLIILFHSNRSHFHSFHSFFFHLYHLSQPLFYRYLTMSWPADLFPSWSDHQIHPLAKHIPVKDDSTYIAVEPNVRPDFPIEEKIRARAPITEEFIPTALPKIIIVGASIGGLFLAIILENRGIPYRIFERSKSCDPIGILFPVLICG
jgi:hypothetical protein